MATKPEGFFPCTVLSATFGEDEKQSPEVQINVRIDEGPSAGQCCTYQDQVNAKSALYVSRSCKAIGWAGKDLVTLKEDCEKWIEKTGGKTTVEIRHVEIKKGKQYDKWVSGGRQGPAPVWDKPNSIGRGPKPLAAAGGSTLSDANDAMRAAMEADGDEIPFASCEMAYDVNPIARVLR